MPSNLSAPSSLQEILECRDYHGAPLPLRTMEKHILPVFINDKSEFQASAFNDAPYLLTTPSFGFWSSLSLAIKFSDFDQARFCQS
jgi:hypothetical protein